MPRHCGSEETATQQPHREWFKAVSKFKMQEFNKIDLRVFDRVNITMQGAELKQLLGEWFIEIMKNFQNSLEKSKPVEEKYLTAEETAQMLGVDKSTLWRWNKCGYLTNIKVGSKVRYRLTDVEGLMKKKG